MNLRKLGLFLHRTRLSPGRLVEVARDRPEGMRDLLIAHATHLHPLKKLDSYIAKTQKGVRDGLLFNGVDFRQFPKLRRAYLAESLSRERVPTPEQLRLILGALPPRGRVCALLMAHTGLRPGILGNDQGTDGLTLEELPELRLDGRPPTIRAALRSPGVPPPGPSPPLEELLRVRDVRDSGGGRCRVR